MKTLYHRNIFLTLMPVLFMLFLGACGAASSYISDNHIQNSLSGITAGSGADAGAASVADPCTDTSAASFSGSGTSGNESIPTSASGKLTVHFIDVGQGDATLIQCGGRSMLIDAGNEWHGTAVQNYLEKQGVTRLDYVIGTHPDADHIGGLDVILYKFDCGTVLLPDVTNDTRAYDDVVQSMKSKSYRITPPVPGDTYTLGSASFTILAPNGDYGSELNDWSIGILLQNGSNRFLFTGDAGETAETDMLANGIDISADVYKAAHHGSRSSTSDAFFAAVNPTYSVISVGDGNTYGHPSAEVLNKFRSAGTQVFRTDEQGTIVAASDGTDITWNASPSGSWRAGEPKGSARDDRGPASVPGNAAQSTDGESAETGAAQSGDVSDDTAPIVYITESGTKYHAPGCSYLKDSAIKIQLSKALSEGFEPCSRCTPAR